MVLMIQELCRRCLSKIEHNECTLCLPLLGNLHVQPRIKFPFPYRADLSPVEIAIDNMDMKTYVTLVTFMEVVLFFQISWLNLVLGKDTFSAKRRIVRDFSAKQCIARNAQIPFLFTALQGRISEEKNKRKGKRKRPYDENSQSIV